MQVVLEQAGKGDALVGSQGGSIDEARLQT